VLGRAGQTPPVVLNVPQEVDIMPVSGVVLPVSGRGVPVSASVMPLSTTVGRGELQATIPRATITSATFFI